jgi:transcriptional regulator with XRE-family HTH domain
VSEEVPQNWAAVGMAVKKHRRALGVRQEDFARSVPISLSIFKEIENHTKVRQRGDGTLSSISQALGLDAEYLDEILTGVRTLDEATDEPSLRSISDTLARFEGRFDAIENRLRTIDATIKEQRDILYGMASPKARVALPGHHPDQDAPGPRHQDDHAAAREET